MGKKLVIPSADFSANGLKAKYVELSWIGNTNNPASFIDSGIAPSPSLKMELTFSLHSAELNSSASGGSYGIGNSVNVNCAVYSWFQTGYTYTYFGTSYIRTPQLWDGLTHRLTTDKYDVLLDSVFNTFSNPAALTNVDRSIYLLGLRTSTGCLVTDSTSQKAFRIRGIRIWANTDDPQSLVLDAIPAKRTSDNAIGFLNRISGEFFTTDDGTSPVYGID